ncbi:NADH-quinone oxidoreductase subunit L [Cohaesibacter sp. ES.047]|uniref:NADH-quinone oxidoreductase subunit L n=1 Tax=Cohaesibacter sp. ES.047 TaxID=1798205 RepID=UPI000BB9A656|nr:NADH-quinone oxidoreductase subunit L [Cohaesibacter sp. ES.047]SNY93728.1 NADH-quinone oxidoreductase subunit L [Cohaesibacter sp. ES.047]
MYTAIVFLPLIGFLIAGLFGRSIGHKAAEYITSSLLVIAALLSWIAFFVVAIGHEGHTEIVTLVSWIHSGDLSIDWTIRVDTLTAVMLVVVNSISALVHIYSIGYMHHDPNRARFFAYLSLFTFAMLSLVTADNLLQMFFGWEGVGLASYLLIGFWYQKPSANAAAMKAFIVNRVGDFGFALGICGVYVLFGTISFSEIFAGADAMKGQTIVFLGHEWDALTTICLLLFMGAMGKSAQFLLHTWLPDAMEGPTPVSALIHAATMVTAGVFMVARLSPLFELSPTALEFVTFIGATTAFFAATVGLVQNDIKRVIAYSTCSQLGYMFVALGIGAYGAAVFHLFTHAFFKALLFLGAGSVIHAVSDEQDMRRMGGLAKHIKVTYWMMMVGTLALTGVGIPGTLIGFAGFNSKDAIIESAFAAQNLMSNYAFLMTVVAALFTSFYSWRLIFMTFHGRERMNADVKAKIHESPKVMTVPLMVLAVGAAFAGMVFSGFFYGHHYDDFWKGALFTAAENDLVHVFHDVPWAVKLAPFVMMLLGLATAYVFYIRKPNLPKRLAERHDWLHKFLLNKWYFDELYDLVFIRPALWLGRILWKGGDERIIDHYGPNGIAARVSDLTGRIVRLQTGYLYHYAFAMMIGVALLVTYIMLSGGAH